MICSCCKNSRLLKYHDTIEVRLPHQSEESKLEVVYTLYDCMYCISYQKVVNACEDRFCERGRHIFDD